MFVRSNLMELMIVLEGWKHSKNNNNPDHLASSENEQFFQKNESIE